MATSNGVPRELKAFTAMAVCGMLPWRLVRLLHVDPLTAYLATRFDVTRP
jgi:uncharacterized membrane protein AbrB (regulator of aidB expression)